MKDTVRYTIFGGVILGFFIGSLSFVSAESNRRTLVQKLVERALERQNVRKIQEGRLEEAKGARMAEGAWPNPTLSVDREQTWEADSLVAEDFVLLEQTVPIWGARQLRREAASDMKEAVKASNRLESLEIEAELREHFYEWLRIQNDLEAARAWRSQIDEAIDKMKAKIASNRASALELEQLKSQHVQIQTQIDELRIEKIEVTGSLEALTGEFESMADKEKIETGLLPTELPGLENILNGLHHHPKLAQLEREISSYRTTRQAVSGSLLPTPVLRGGYKRANIEGSGIFHGFNAGISIHIPLFSQADGESKKARAKVTSLSARKDRLRRQKERKIRATYRALELASESAKRYREGVLNRAKQQLATVNRRWNAGDASLSDLIDSQRQVFEARLKANELAWRARAKQIQLRKTAGGFK